MMRVERLAEDVTLYLGDCREVLPTLPRPAAIICDPPYGQRQNTNVRGKGGTRTYRNARGVIRDYTVWPDTIIGDDVPFEPTWLIDAADVVLLWGAHRFGHALPAGSWLIWDKVPTGKLRDQGCGEAAWLSGEPRPMRIFRFLWDGLCVGKRQPDVNGHIGAASAKRLHPTQKPLELMAWCIAQARVPNDGMILDPYMGSGSTGVAALRAGHPFAGCELEPLYFDTACRRLSAEAAKRSEARRAT